MVLSLSRSLSCSFSLVLLFFRMFLLVAVVLLCLILLYKYYYVLHFTIPDIHTLLYRFSLNFLRHLEPFFTYVISTTLIGVCMCLCICMCVSAFVFFCFAFVIHITAPVCFNSFFYIVVLDFSVFTVVLRSIVAAAARLSRWCMTHGVVLSQCGVDYGSQQQVFISK